MKPVEKIIHTLQHFLRCNAKNCKHYTFALKIYKSLVKESRRLRTKCDRTQWAMCPDKVEWTKLPVVNYTHKNLKIDHAQGWCWHWWTTCSNEIFKTGNKQKCFQRNVELRNWNKIKVKLTFKWNRSWNKLKVQF